jgi:transcriptional regulator with XRE-family HTH domain
MTPAQCRAARALIGMEQAQLASAASVARSTVVDFERGTRTPRDASLAAIRAALEAAGVEFIPENGGGHGVRLRARG